MKKIFTIVILALSINAFAQVPNYVPINGLISWYPFNGNANDESGNGHNGTVFNATLDNDRNGNPNSAYRFGKYNSYIAIDTSNTMFYTFAGWVNDFNKLDTSIFIIKNTNGWLYGHGYLHEFWNEYLDGGHVQTTPNFSQCQHFTDITTYSPDSTWHFVAFTSDGSMIRVYMDTIELNSTSCSIDTRNSEIKYIGGIPNIDFGGFNGLIDDVGIWNRKLSTQELNTLYNNSLLTTNVEKSNANFIEVYPNPNSGQFKINVKNKSNLNTCSFKITNELGQTIFNSKITQQQSYFDLSNFIENGLYFLHLIDSTNNVFDVKKIVIQ